MNLIKGKSAIMRIVFFVLLLSTVILTQPEQSAFVTVEDDSDLVTILKADMADPFSKEAKICFSLKDAVNVSVRIVSPQGETIRDLLSAELAAGKHTISWDGKDDNGAVASSGVFVYEIHARQVKRSAMLALLN